jgi:exonuclease SbcC
VISSLRLRGWKSHEDTKVEFTPGTNVFVGIMGSGKSSVLQGLTFALFGETPEIRSRTLTLTDLIMRKPRRLEEAVVELEFGAGDFNYRVERRVTGGGGEAKLYREDKLLDVGVRRVTRRVAKLLGTDYDTFANVVYAQQNDIDNFLRYGKSDRVRLIDGLLKIDRLEEARKKLRSFHTGVKGRLAELQEKAARDTSEPEELLEAVEKKVRMLEEELSNLQAATARLRDKLSGRRLRFEEMDRRRARRDDLKSYVSHLRGEKSSLESRLESLPQIKGAGKKLKAASEKLGELKAREKELISGLSSLEGRKEQLEERIAELRGYEELAATEPGDVEGLAEARERVAYLKAQLESHRQAAEQLRSAGAKCPVCGSKLKDPSEHVRRHEKAVKELEGDLESAESELDGLEEARRENEKLRARVEKARLMVKELPGLEEQLGGMDTGPLRGELKDVQELLSEQEGELERLKQAFEREEASKRLGEIKKDLETHESELKSVGFDEPKYAELRGEMESLSSELSSNKSRMQSIPSIIEARQSEAAAMRRELKDIREAREEAKRTEKNLESLSLLINSISDVQVIVRQRFVEAVNEILSNIWGQLYPYGDYSSLRVDVETDGRRTGDYVLQLREPRGWVNVEGVASGGERSIASIALRVAFARALSSMGLLLLDEPTHNLDDSGINKLSDVLREGMPNVLDQVVIITHEERMEKASTGNVYRLDRDKAAEQPTRAERL